jgi:hypothetical protein
VPERPQPAQVWLNEADVLGQLDHITGGSPRAPRSRPMPPRRAYLRPAAPTSARTCCWPRRAPAPARRWAISPPPRCGRAPAAARSGSAPTPRRCNASFAARPPRLGRKHRRGGAQGARELSVPAEPGGRAARRLWRPRGNPGATGRALGRLYAGWRHDRRRSARLAAHAVPPARHRQR